jgi:hypothetical protein
MSDKCRCAEMLDAKGKRMEIEHERFHDCSYVVKRSALCNAAAWRVLERHGVLPGPRFTRLFAQEMEKAVREAKLV